MKQEAKITKPTSKKEVETLFFNTSSAKLQRFYTEFDFKWKVLIVILMGFLIGVVALFFVKNSGLYSLGIAAVTQGLSRIITTSIDAKTNASDEVVSLISSLTFWFFLLIVNIPLLIFAWKKIGKKFSILTLIYLVSNSVFSFALNRIPNIDDVLLLGNVESIIIQDNMGKDNISSPVMFLVWNTADNSKVISLVFYGLLAPILTTGLYAIVYIIGASTGGADIISIYWFKSKLKSLSKVFLVLNIILLFIGYFLGSFLTIGIGYDTWDVEQTLLGPNFVCSLFINILFSVLLDKLYPRYKMVSVKIIGKNVNKINDKLNEIGYIHSRTLYKGVGSYSKQEMDCMETYCFFTEVHDLIRTIRTVDENAFIVVNKNIEISGKLSLYKFIE